MSAIIETANLTKRYGRHRGIVDLTFQVQAGESFGFLGPNGAGKTTTIRTLLGFLKPTAGSAAIAGLDCWTQPSEVHRVIGYLPGEFTFDPSLTGAQIIAYLGNLRGGVDQQYALSLVERFELDPSRRFHEYSRGNKQKVGLVQAFMHHPRLLILDEPTSGLDPLNQQEFYRLVAEVQGQGATVFLSSHNLAEVEHTCQRVGIIREGRLVKVDAVHTLKELQHYEVEVTFAGPASPDWFRRVPGVLGVSLSPEGHRLLLTVQGTLGDVVQEAARHDATNLTTREPSLEEVFLRYYAPAPAAPAVTV
ncbi:MAG TPA: ABC transporter ATP-binding protein [Chloroflexota bacterium]|nr:ABC transporter ATP-binding protein [Chloroflexota bacterium]